MTAWGSHLSGPATRRGPSTPANRRRAVLLAAALVVSGMAMVVAPSLAPPASAATVINVPGDQPTIQAAVQAASSGDTILLAPGTHQGGVWIQDKALTFASWYHTTGDPAYIEQTVVNGYGPNVCNGASGCAGDAVLEFGSRAGGSNVIGLTVSGGMDGVRGNSRVDITHSRMTGNEDGVDFGNDSSGTWAHNVFDRNTDDGIDLNGRVSVTLRDSTVELNEGDGIEFRLYPYTGPMLDVSFIGNRFIRNDSDAIQLIDSDGASSRVIHIERNVFDHNLAAAVGCLPDGQTTEDFSGAPMEERVYFTNNTVVGDRYGISGGANSIVLNNIFTGIPVRALHRVGGGSISAYNLFWNNGTDFAESVVDQQSSVFADPLLANDHTLLAGSPAIDAGTASYQWNGEPVLNIPAGSYAGAAPDLGAYEHDPNGGGSTPNQAPTVNAGPDQTVTLPDGASLDGTVADDGRPSNAVTTQWTQAAGPGTVTFGNTAAVDTTATFSEAGTYQLRLTASDGALSASDTVQVVAQATPPAGSGVVDSRISAGSDDAEESATGSYSGSSSDLELVYDGSNQQVGLRFANLAIPRGASITRAYVQFETDEAQSESTSLTIRGQAADNPATFSSANKVSTRPRTTASVTWAPAAWTTAGEAGPNQRTADLSAVVQEIVNRAGWVSGNALALLIEGTGHRTAEAFEGRAAGAPLLHVEYGPAGPIPNQAPVVNAGADQIVTLPGGANLDATVTDDGKPSGNVTTQWSQVTGPGTATFATPSAVDTTATFSEPGTYVLQLTADDSELTGSDSVQVTVRAQSPPGSGTTIMGAGDIASSGSTLVNATATGDLIREAAPDAAITLGDNAYVSGTLQEYQTSYDPTWGSFKGITRPIPGNHDYEPGPPSGYMAYFGSANVTNPVDGGLYYAWNVNDNWRAYALNTEVDTSGPQLTWLRNDLAAHPGKHYILYTHHPRYSSGADTNYAVDDVCPLWNAMAETGGLEMVLTAHHHSYERFTRMDCAGNTSATGARQFVVGTGGNTLYPFGTTVTGSQFRNGTDYGVLKLVLQESSYTWSFIASGRGWNGSTSVDTGNKGQVLDTGTQATLGAPSPGNAAPTVDAGPDQTVTLPGSASLDGTVTDDNLPNPPAAVTTTWSQVSGPGTVSFTNASAVDTSAAFSDPGDYVLRLTATDSDATASDLVAVKVEAAPGGGTAQTVEVRVPSSANDVEQAVSGASSLSSSDLELTTDGSTQQIVGTRFPGLAVPHGATVTRAYVQFQVDEVSTGASAMTIRAEASDNAALYTSTSGSVAARAVTGSVPWTPPDWSTVGAAGADQRTTDVSSLVQAVVNRSGWVSGNALALQLSGSGRRTAEAFDGSAAGAPLLHVEYTTGGGGGTPTNQPPTVGAGADQTITLPASGTLDGTVTDDGLPAPPAAVTTTWTKVSGPGTVAFGNANAVDTTATFSGAGTYVLQLTADDSAATASDTVTVTVQSSGGGGGTPTTIERRVTTGTDDVEQAVSGSMYVSSSDLEITTDGATQQVIGTRFTDIQVPQGARIVNAYVQFQVDAAGSAATNVAIAAESSDNAATYTRTSGNVTARSTTGSVTWTPPAWPTVGAAGVDQRTPDISALVQAVVNRSGWTAGNALALQFSGTGTRSADSFEGSAAGAPLIHIEWVPAG